MLAAPPRDAKFVRAATPPITVTPKLARSNVAVPKRTVSRRRAAAEPGAPVFLAPVDEGRLPAGVRPDIPSSYGLETLRTIAPSKEDRLVLVYGGRYLAIVKGVATEAVFDMEAFRHPPKVDETWKEFAVGDVTYGIVEDGV